MFSRYHYMTLWHQQSLGDGKAVPFTVIVESKRFVYCIGLYLDGDDSVAGQVLKNFPAVLKERVESAAREAGREGLAVDVLRRDFAWNVRAGVLRSVFSWRGIEELAHHLFVKHVENWSPSSPRAHRRTSERPLSIFVLDLPSVAFGAT